MPEFSQAVSDAEHRRLEEFLEALRTPCSAVFHASSWLRAAEFEEEFRSKLLAHHCFIGSPLFQESFDSAFISACTSAGMNVEAAPSGQRFWDVVVGGRKLSLKSSKAKGLKNDKLAISKLTEAAWIQDCRTAAKRHERTCELFSEYCGEVDSILQLRYFAKLKLYELVEIPVSIFRQVLDLKKQEFASDGPTINIPVGQIPPDFTLKLDRSDAKITLTNINKEICVVHGTWQL